MTLDEFKASLDGDAPPTELSAPMKALWHQARGDWHEAHGLAQSARGQAGHWVHAHLHRVEGDDANAGYWYRRAGKSPPSSPVEVEWEEIAAALLSG